MLGDFNLGDSKRLNFGTSLKNMLNDQIEAFNDYNLIQLAKILTWSCIINNNPITGIWTTAIWTTFTPIIELSLTT